MMGPHSTPAPPGTSPKRPPPPAAPSSEVVSTWRPSGSASTSVSGAAVRPNCLKRCASQPRGTRHSYAGVGGWRGGRRSAALTARKLLACSVLSPSRRWLRAASQGPSALPCAAPRRTLMNAPTPTPIPIPMPIPREPTQPTAAYIHAHTHHPAPRAKPRATPHAPWRTCPWRW